ncbi:MAG: adenylosuccinate lyase [Eubacteriales bacterium]
MDRYENPLGARYASEAMQQIFSPNNKFRTWRRLWVALAEAEAALGLPITEEQLQQLRAHVEDIDYERAAVYEAQVRHDVMAHVKTYGDACPAAAGIIHLGATSCYVGDNTDIIIMKQGLLQLRRLLVNCIAAVADFSQIHKALPTLAYTHFQAAQPTTLGKRATLWLQDLMLDLDQLDFQLGRLKLLGCKGTTGTAASFLDLFDQDHDRVKALERLIAEKMGFEDCYPVSGQTYSRKVDYQVLSVLSGIAQSAAKFSNDIRLMAHLKEFDEPFESGQIGSSAMAYKRNPMRCERIASLARYVMVDTLNPAITAAGQWLERTLDDSANRRIAIPEAFLAVDGILSLYINVVRGGVVYPNMIRRHLEEEMPFMVTERILMHCTKKGGNRQVLHEALRRHSVDTTRQIKLHGSDNDLFRRILTDPTFDLTEHELAELVKAEQFTGRARQQTEEFLRSRVMPLLEANADLLGMTVRIQV